MKTVVLLCALFGAPGTVLAHEVPGQGFILKTFDPPVVPPVVSGTALDGRTIGLGVATPHQVTLINFWATWCAPCVREMPSLQRLQDRFGDGQIRVVAVSIDAAHDRSKLERFVERHRLRIPVVHDADKAIAQSYHAIRFPNSVVLDRAGRVIGVAVGERQWDTEPALSYFRQLVSEPGKITASNGQELQISNHNHNQ